MSSSSLNKLEILQSNLKIGNTTLKELLKKNEGPQGPQGPEGPQGPQGTQGIEGSNAAAPLTNKYRSGTTAHFNLTYGASDSYGSGRTTNVTFDAEGNVSITNPTNQFMSWGALAEESAFFQFTKSSSEVDSLDSMYFAIDVTGTTGTVQVYLSTFDNGMNFIPEYSFGKPITTDGRHTMKPYFPPITDGETWTFQLGIRAVSQQGGGSVTSGVTVTGVYIESDLKFGDNTYGINFSVDGGDTIGQYPYHLYPDRTSDAIQKVYESGFNIIRLYGMAVDGSNVLALLNAIKTFNDSLTLDLQHKRIQVAIGIYETSSTSASDKTSFITNAISFVETFDFVHSIYIGNEQIGIDGFGFAELTQTISDYRTADSKSYAAKYGKSSLLSYAFRQTTYDGNTAAIDALDLDYLSVNLYSGYFANVNNKDYSVDTQMGVIISDISTLTTAHSLKKLIISESGWQNFNSDTRVIASHSKQQDFYEKMSKLVYQKSYNGSSSPNSIPFMFYFVLSDEGWKGGDNHWGIYFQGTSSSLGNRKIITDSFWSND